MAKQEFFYHLSLLHEKIQQVQALVHLGLPHQSPTQQGSIASRIGSIMQEVVFTASSLMTISQSFGLNAAKAQPRLAGPNEGPAIGPLEGEEWVLMEDGSVHLDGYPSGLSIDIFNDLPQVNHGEHTAGFRFNGQKAAAGSLDTSSCEIIELSPADILAEFTHYCHICGKGFKRGANLRMHMRAHGDEYKTNAALVRPKDNTDNGMEEDSPLEVPRKYSCPHEGCRWNKNHAKFQPLKSMICVKNHYKRSHCPKVYVCKRCNSKKFSVLADLRTHEKHCGDLKWQCSCGTSFSRKDKLLGHVALFKGHTPFVRCSNLPRKN
ncbi:unnamed protein product [Victoria cruziana]